MLQYTPPSNVLILGASGATGSEVCRRLHEAGSLVVAAGRSPEKLENVACRERVLFDALQPESIEEAVQQAAKITGDLSAVVNCVGSVVLKPAHLTSFDQWNECLTLNLTSCFAVLKSAKSLCREGSSVVFITSAAADVGLANHEAISAAKAGIEGLVRSSSNTYASSGLRVNAVAPGLVETPLTSKITSNESARSFSLKMHPVGRLGSTSDIASAICWLLSPENSWVSGEVLHVDGGLSRMKT